MYEGHGFPSLGIHFLVELKECNLEIINSLDRVRSAMLAAAEKANATVVDNFFHEFNPFGISGVVSIDKSHLTIHTWPEYCYAAVDFFTCDEKIRPEVAAQFLIEAFGSKKPSITEMKRGMLTHDGQKLPHEATLILQEA